MLEVDTVPLDAETPSSIALPTRPSSRVEQFRETVQKERSSRSESSPSKGSPKACSAKGSPKTCSSKGYPAARPQLAEPTKSSGTLCHIDTLQDASDEEDEQDEIVPVAKPKCEMACPRELTTKTPGNLKSGGSTLQKGFFARQRSVLPKSRIPSRLIITIDAHMADLNVDVELTEGEFEGPGALPLTLSEGQKVSLTFRGTGPIVGALQLGDAEPISFGVQSVIAKSGDASNFINEEGKLRCTVTHCGDLKAQNSLNVSGDGLVVEASMSEGPRADLSVVVRSPKKKEFRRVHQQRALVSAMENQKYSTLLAQITKARMRKVEASIIDQATRLLKSIKPGESSFLNHKQLQNKMKWKKVTDNLPGDIVEPCTADPDCPCNAGQAENGEICVVTDGEVNKALEGVLPTDGRPDKELFQALVRAAICAPEGCVWKSGGKFLLTNEERNQSANAIVNLLERGANGEETFAARGIRALVDYTEKLYNFKVTAVQLNFHPNEKTWHKQHRDIYGAGQKAGINCTCTFMKCQGTVCYSLGSSRHVMTETITDSRSKYEGCGDNCTGCKNHKLMSSGSAMFFNHKWNNNHTHGVPQLDETCGPRISVALLCA